jgi:hypothetical protein
MKKTDLATILCGAAHAAYMFSLVHTSRGLPERFKNPKPGDMVYIHGAAAWSRGQIHGVGKLLRIEADGYRVLETLTGREVRVAPGSELHLIPPDAHWWEGAMRESGMSVAV